ncbi:hypothetical protein NQZ79_g1969 [Umbelopsis isabellina]|nr:hypothetical protein NQZ79_g1969 [Umbelopsis isabellina]
MSDNSSESRQENLPSKKLATTNYNEAAADPIPSSIDDPESDKTLGHRDSIEILSGPEDSHYDPHDRRYSLAEVPDISHSMPVDTTEEPKPDGQSLKLYENKLIIFAALIPVSIIGMLIRVGLTSLETYSGAPVFALVYVQFIGCTIMGFVAKKKDFLLKKYLPLQIALSTGLCGSITTFSSWQLAIFEAFANTSGDSHATGYNVLAGLSQILVTMAVSVVGLEIGYHLAYTLDHIVTHQLARKLDTRAYTISPIGYRLSREPKDIISFIVGVLSWIAVIVVAATVLSNKKLSLACVFAPLGTLLRWWLSRYNTRIAGFPLGTLIANLIATLVLAVVTLLMSGPVSSFMSCSVLQGISDGFCGKCALSMDTLFTALLTNDIKNKAV